MSKVLLTITGPSGSGKSTIAGRLEKNYGIGKLITCTTRAPREREKSGTDYFFLSSEEFCSRKILAPTVFANTLYGIDRNYLKAELRYSNKKVLAIILDPVGAKLLKEANDPILKNVIIKSLFIDVAPKIALARMGRRDGWRKAKNRQKADFEAGMYMEPFKLAQIYDCVLRNEHSNTAQIVYEAACYVKALETMAQLAA